VRPAGGESSVIQLAGTATWAEAAALGLGDADDDGELDALGAAAGKALLLLWRASCAMYATSKPIPNALTGSRMTSSTIRSTRHQRRRRGSATAGANGGGAGAPGLNVGGTG
jgi:hypothetical protein